MELPHDARGDGARDGEAEQLGPRTFLAILQQMWGESTEWEEGQRTWWEARQRQLNKEPSGLLEFQDYREARDKFLHDFLVEPLLSAASEEQRKILSDVPVGFVRHRSFNAQTVRAPNGKPLILINEGLLAITSFFWEIFISLPVVEAESGKHAAANYTAEMYCFILNYFEQAGQVEFPRKFIGISEDDYRLALRSSVQAEMFVLAHEYAHVLAGDLEDAETKAAIGGDGTSGRLADFYQLSQEQEFAADWLGFNLYLDAWPLSPWSGGDIEPWDTVASLYFFLPQILIELNIARRESSSTHPPAWIRVAELLYPVFSQELTLPEHVELRDRAQILLDLIQSIPFMTEYLVPETNEWNFAQGVSSVVVGISISPEVGSADSAALIEAFDAEFRITNYGKSLAADWTTVIAVAKDAGSIIGAVNGIITLAAKINDWRRKVKDRDAKPAVRLQNRGEIIDLSTATDEEVEQWLSTLRRENGTSPAE